MAAPPSYNLKTGVAKCELPVNQVDGKHVVPAVGPLVVDDRLQLTLRVSHERTHPRVVGRAPVHAELRRRVARPGGRGRADLRGSKVC